MGIAKGTDHLLWLRQLLRCTAQAMHNMCSVQPCPCSQSGSQSKGSRLSWLSGFWHTSMMEKITWQRNRNYLHVHGQFHGILIEVQPRNDCVKYSGCLRRRHGAKEDCLKRST